MWFHRGECVVAVVWYARCGMHGVVTACGMHGVVTACGMHGVIYAV